MVVDFKIRITMLPVADCRISYSGFLYTGQISQTENGLECQRWDSNTPHSHDNDRVELFPDDVTSLSDIENYCRNPDAENTLWCYTIDSVDESRRWEFCDIPKCTGTF